MLFDEERLQWADLRLELQDALKRDTDLQKVKLLEIHRKRDEDALSLKRQLDGTNNKLDDFITRVNNHADAIDDLKIAFDTDKLRCLKIRETLQKRLSDANFENEQVERLIQECSSLHISNLVTLQELKHAYEEVEASKEQSRLRQEELKARKERLGQLQTLLSEEKEVIQHLEDKLKMASEEERKLSLEIDAAQEYIERLNEEIEETQIKAKGFVSREKELAKELEEIEQKFKELQSIFVTLKARSEVVNSETGKWNKIYSHLEWDYNQRQLQKIKERTVKKEESEGNSKDSRQAAKSEVEGINESPTRSIKRQLKADGRENFNETFSTIVFDPVQVVASTPAVSPKRKSPKRIDNELGKTFFLEPETLRKSPTEAAKKTQRKMRTCNRRTRASRRTVTKAVGGTRSAIKESKRAMYDMLDSE
ncbi:unnamed protein product [Enterobius vermicularis]|uniref:SWI5-dependent HO expression protein 3 n=1 Tax=Enterobius vermicularis TaxID=51028 RepID=A0A0N4V5S8_ENTVE|nr:unnamed protein product [Enterobius vermicularis]